MQNEAHARTVAEIAALVADYENPSVRPREFSMRFIDKELEEIVDRHFADGAAATLGAVIDACGFKPWFSHLDRRDCSVARRDWGELTAAGRMQRLRWLLKQMEAWQ